MKKQNLTKFALSLVCAAVLSACGGSDNGASDNGSTKPVVSEAEQKIQALLTAATTENTNSKLELSEDNLKAFAAKFGATVDATDAAAVKAALTAFKADLDKVNQSSDINDQVDVSKPFTNFQIAKNNKSNLGLDDIKKTSSDTISFSRGTVEFHPSFDTIVVATPSPTHSQGKTVYLEDFHFNSTTGKNLVKDNEDALTKLNEVIYTSDVQTKFADTKNFKDFYAVFAAQKSVLEKSVKTEETKDKTSDDYKKAVAALELYNLYDAGLKDGKFADDLETDSKTAAGQENLKKVLEASIAYVFEKRSSTVGHVPSEASRAILNKQGVLQAYGRDDAEYTMAHGIYVDKDTTKNSTSRATNETESDTETSTIGDDKAAKALRYQNERRVYITADTQKAADAMNYVSVGTGGKNNVRSLENTVAEVYGNKTFTYEIGTGTDDGYDQVNDGGNNLPLFGYDAKTGSYKGAVLSRVQYGRVTSKLHNVDPADLKPGVPDETLVGSYGSYGKAGTENHFFARGSDHITADSLKALGNSATLVYEGHAVSYGLNNRYDGLNSNAIPNAIGTSYKLHSGNHVEAKINLADNTVTGSIFNKWTTGKNDADGNLSVTPVELVKFTGTLAANGNITGDAALTYGEKTAGTLSAALYGQDAQELGGAVQSKDYTDGKAWGAVFGAHRVAEKKTATETSSPLNPRNEIRN